MQTFSSGPKYLENKTLSAILDDKVESVATHFTWAVRNCGENSRELQDRLLNTLEHFKNNHQR